MRRIMVFSICLAIMLSGTLSAFASGTDNRGEVAAALDPQRLKMDLVEFDKRHNTKSFIVDDIDPSTIRMKFDTLDEYERFIDSLEIVFDDKAKSIYEINKSGKTGDFNAMTGIAAATTLQKSIYRDAKIYGSGVYLGKLRNKVVVKYYMNLTYNQYRFNSWVSQSSYPTGTVAFDWDQDYETHSIVDSQRTLLSTVNGHLTVGAIVGGVYIGTMEVENLLYSYGYTML